MDAKITKNIIYNVLYQIITVVLPLFTVPYISRVLGADGIGINSYVNSITQYFIIIGTLGMSLYGNRQIAYVRDDKAKLSEEFWALVVMRLLTMGLAMIIYWCIFCKGGTYCLIFKLQTINIVAAMLDISWLYMGLEDFKKTVSRNIIVKLVGVLLIFLMIKKAEDLVLYVAILVIMELGGNLIMWFYLPKVVSKAKVSLKTIKVHIVPVFKLFIPQIAIQVYAVLDKTMIGLLSDMTQVGYYEQTEKVVKAIMGLITSVGTVMLPRMSNIFVKGRADQIKAYLNQTMQGVAYIAIPMAVGLASIASLFVKYFFGEAFAPAGNVMIALTPIIFLIAWSNIMGMQYLMPTNKSKAFTVSVTIGAIVNCGVNLICIPPLGAIGACVGTVCAELTVTAIQYMYLREIIDHQLIRQSVVSYILAATIMYISLKVIGNYLGESIMALVIQCILGAMIYLVVLGLLKEKTNLQVIKSIYKIKILVKK